MDQQNNINERRAHVCHLSSGHESYELRIFQKQCASLARHYRVTLIIPNDIEAVVRNVRVIPFKKYASRLSRFSLAPFRMYVSAKAVKADVYHFHDPELILTGLLLKLFTASKVVYDVHEDMAGAILSRPTFRNKCLKRVIAALFDVYERAMSGYFDLVVCVTDTIARKFTPRCKVEVIYNFPFIDRFVSGSGQGDGSVVFYGNMTELRGVRKICDAIKMLNESYGKWVRLKLIGTISPPELETEIVEKYGRYVDYVRWVPIEQAYQMVQRSSIGVVTYLSAPNHDHCLPNKLFEYMSFGMPVVCSNFDEMKSVVENSECGICVDPSSSSDIANAIMQILDDPLRAAAMGSKGAAAVRNIYNWGAMEERLYRCYAALCQNISVDPKPCKI